MNESIAEKTITLLFPKCKSGKQGHLMVAAFTGKLKEVNPALGTVRRIRALVSICSHVELTHALNEKCLDDQENPDTIDRQRIDMFCETVTELDHQDVSQTPDALQDLDVKITRLTRRELELVELMWRGANTTEIAETWHRSQLTVTKHRENLNHKLGHKIAPRDMDLIMRAAVLTRNC
jgi:DNA-binding CsgD family transcriptional regulator